MFVVWEESNRPWAQYVIATNETFRLFLSNLQSCPVRFQVWLANVSSVARNQRRKRAKSTLKFDFDDRQIWPVRRPCVRESICEERTTISGKYYCVREDD